MYFKSLIIFALFSLFIKKNLAFICKPCMCEETENSLIRVECSYKTSETAENQKLNRIPPSIETYTYKQEFEEFNFEGQHFNELDYLSTFYNVEKIVFSNNLISSLHPNSLKNLTLLKTLYLNNNQISEIPLDFFQNNHKIAYIFLNSNKITSLAKNIFVNLRNLTEVHLNQNYIERIEDHCFVNVPSLTTLDLSNNKLKSLSLNFIDHDNSLVFVYLDKNPWLCDFKLCDLINTSLEKKWLHGRIPECFHSNGTKTRTDWEHLQILEPMQILHFQSEVDINQSVVLNCQVHTCSFPSMGWSFNGNYLENSSHCIEGFKHTLTIVIDEIQKDNEGSYTCFINNCHFCENSTRYLTVNDVVSNVETTILKEKQNTSSDIDTNIDLPDIDLPEFCLLCIIYLIIGIFIGIPIGFVIGILIILFLLPFINRCCIGKCKCFQRFINKLESVITHIKYENPATEPLNK